LTQWTLILAISLCFFFQHNAMTIATQSANSSFVAILSQINIVYASFIDWFVFDLTLNAYQCLGIAIVVILNILLIYDKMSQGKTETGAK
jgi:drug/metabolite transporter (DMT)-like permease